MRTTIIINMQTISNSDAGGGRGKLSLSLLSPRPCKDDEWAQTHAILYGICKFSLVSLHILHASIFSEVTDAYPCHGQTEEWLGTLISTMRSFSSNERHRCLNVMITQRGTCNLLHSEINLYTCFNIIVFNFIFFVMFVYFVTWCYRELKKHYPRFPPHGRGWHSKCVLGVFCRKFVVLSEESPSIESVILRK